MRIFIHTDKRGTQGVKFSNSNCICIQFDGSMILDIFKREVESKSINLSLTS